MNCKKSNHYLNLQHLRNFNIKNITNSNENKDININHNDRRRSYTNADFIGTIQIIDVIVSFCCIFYHYHLHYRHRKAFRRKPKLMTAPASPPSRHSLPLISVLTRDLKADAYANPTKNLTIFDAPSSIPVQSLPASQSCDHFSFPGSSFFHLLMSFSLNFLLIYFKKFFISIVIILEKNSGYNKIFSNYCKLATTTARFGVFHNDLMDCL